ncbi:hypothetical protein BGX38DRAFT_646658 [Terfezia claveryi]|nr:hypothetical protein BGX38DRAFT_646658 [Terfezia claveryi]
MRKPTWKKSYIKFWHVYCKGTLSCSWGVPLWFCCLSIVVPIAKKQRHLLGIRLLSESMHKFSRHVRRHLHNANQCFHGKSVSRRIQCL